MPQTVRDGGIYVISASNSWLLQGHIVNHFAQGNDDPSICFGPRGSEQLPNGARILEEGFLYIDSLIDLQQDQQSSDRASANESLIFQVSVHVKKNQ